MSTAGFYKNLPSFSNFNHMTRDSHFQRLPEDWKVVVADIQGSTKAIEAGRYRDVNTLGAAAIVATQNAMNKEEFPYVFGGDGATLVIPPQAAEAVSKALDGVRAMAREHFSMTLRVGLVEVKDLYEEGCKIEVAKFEIFAGKSIALFRGGGLAKADEKVKGEEQKYAVAEREKHESDLGGLSCRWQPIPSGKGKMLSLLVLGRGEKAQSVYDQVLKKLGSLFKGGVETANPVHISNMKYKSISKNLRDEWRYHNNRMTLSFIGRALGIIAAVLVFKFHLPPLVFNPYRYASSIGRHSDFRKFDDVLRMVIDCSEAQIGEIRHYLEGLRSEGQLCYGMHVSDTALMTCFVYDVSDGGHIHFIDGGDGGYAMAAKEFKAQLKS